MIDWKEPLRTVDGHKAVRIYKLDKCDFPYIVKFKTFDGKEHVKSVNENGHDGQMFFIMNASKKEEAWPANRELMIGCLLNMRCLDCGASLIENQEKQVNQSKASITIFAICSECKIQFVYAAVKEIKKEENSE